jgi:hypothetical protein
MTESLGFREEAELYRLGLLCGYFSTPTVVRWAERAIAREDSPPLDLIELSLSSRDTVNNAILHLYPLALGSDTQARASDLYGLLGRRLERDRSDVFWVALRTHLLAKEIGDERLANRANAWHDELLADGSWGDPAAILREMLTTLRAFEISSTALAHEA